MEIEDIQTTSVSRGVFVFKNNFKKPSKSKSKPTTRITNELFEHQWYNAYKSLWEWLSSSIERLNTTMFTTVTRDLVSFLKDSYNNDVTEIPAAALMTGINMPDHEMQFVDLKNHIRRHITPHVAFLYSRDCQNMKYLMETMIGQFVNKVEGFIDTEEELTYKKSQLNLQLLNKWYQRQTQASGHRHILTILIQDFESFNPTILQKLILVLSNYLNQLPFVLVFGIATSLATLHTALPFHVSSKVNVKVFNALPPTQCLNDILENVFFKVDCPFQLGGKVFNLFTDIFLFYDFSVNNFVENIRFAMAEHFCYGNASALCRMSKAEIIATVNKFTEADLENARHIRSFRKLVENNSYENRIRLLTDDVYFRHELYLKVLEVHRYIKRLHIFLKCLHILVADLPGSPLGKQLRELYAVAVSENLTRTAQYKESIQLLKFQSKDELVVKLRNVIDHVSSFVNVHYNKRSPMLNFVSTLTEYVKNLEDIEANNDGSLEVADKDASELLAKETEVNVANVGNRQQLKEALLSKSKTKPKTLNKYEKLRVEILDFISITFEQYLINPKSFYFHEIFFFDDISIQTKIIGTHRTAIHNALNDPSYYLNCDCCGIPNEMSIKPTMPDICVAYKLHLECGKMINLYDWLQAFLSITDPQEYDEDSSKRTLNPALQARFTQAVAELEYLGFIKSSKRKTDHVARLTWGG